MIQHVQFDINVLNESGSHLHIVSLTSAILYTISRALIGRQCQLCAKTQSNGVIESNDLHPRYCLFGCSAETALDDKERLHAQSLTKHKYHTMPQIKSVAIIGAGPAGAITVDALAQEKAFDVIHVFERQEKAGGCWYVTMLLYYLQRFPLINKRVSRDDEPSQQFDFDGLAARTADAPLKIPEHLPCRTPVVSQDRFTDSPVYPTLETNVNAGAMSFSQEEIPTVRSQWSIERHGADTPFRHHSVIRKYIEDLFNRKGYQDLVQYNTTVERAIKDPSSKKWVLTFRRTEVLDGVTSDYWWSEEYDAVVVASGHYAVPFIPVIPGLKEFAARYPGSVQHTKHYRGPEKYRGKVNGVPAMSFYHLLTHRRKSSPSERLFLLLILQSA